MGFVSVAYWMLNKNGELDESLYLTISLVGFLFCLIAQFLSLMAAMNKVSNKVSVYSSPFPVVSMGFGWSFFLIGVSGFLLFLVFRQFPPSM